MALTASAPVPARAQSAPECPPAPLIRLHLPHLQAALTAGKEAVIVALGSSSTRGEKASDPAHSYPAVLQTRLAQALPGWHVAVLNRGINGQDAPEELARLSADVIAVRPQLVIWQVGANGAMRKSDPERFRQRVTEGVRELQAAGIDVVLMDNQHCPRVDATPEGVLLDQVLGQVAKQVGAGLFSRAALMETWQR
ncbi:MAG TPA: GDSL-type esterase/lipase family protein, partial [Acetobacteraceae bacterium]|nr:GDSL-type esterase/lipase family protein [Acetobacteraceae bacterium]